MFAPHTSGISKDLATGSASGPLGAYLLRHGCVNAAPEIRLISEQGTKMVRQSFGHLRLRPGSGDAVANEVGGSTVPVLEGVLHLP